MIIEVKQGVNWDTELAIQSEAAMQWIQEDVRPNFGEPIMDDFSRPYTRTYENETVIVTEKQLYITETSDWARKGVEYNVTIKSA